VRAKLRRVQPEFAWRGLSAPIRVRGKRCESIPGGAAFHSPPHHSVCVLFACFAVIGHVLPNVSSYFLCFNGADLTLDQLIGVRIPGAVKIIVWLLHLAIACENRSSCPLPPRFTSLLSYLFTLCLKRMIIPWISILNSIREASHLGDCFYRPFIS
jgi:hypothetical protein